MEHRLFVERRTSRATWRVLLVVLAVVVGAMATSTPAQADAHFDGELRVTEFHGPLSVGDTIELSWEVVDADTLTASGDWTGAKPLGPASETVTLTHDGISTFVLTANAGEPDEAVQRVSVSTSVDFTLEPGQCQKAVATNSSDVTVRVQLGANDEEGISGGTQADVAPGASTTLTYPYDLSNESPYWIYSVRDTDGSYAPVIHYFFPLPLRGMTACPDAPTKAPAAGIAW